ncbi:translational activator of cytochrome c oxidase 1 [Anguilla anguilla]|uniref:translational activator of cytochrome c oxidase 1 n=1 Tax=Anguilla anguilla TaxID=7936 RepID=UPI0015ACC333|nr:translational activator of cytochrome c oxidase 1 [Anguilla anguilla]XP_035256499.1 translational activator of cytochrome c oxidase 1 [Anguilla anguilla]XP_035256508.1 translational activator of cytochrome c oxidase 1 [Anguilla anguilla]
MAGGVVFLRGLLPRYCRWVTFGNVLLHPQISSVHPPVAVILGQFSQRTLQPCCAIHHCSVMCAGHNKWSKVKNVKGPKDAARSRMFMKYSMMIRVAVREGGPNPNFNVQLANLIEQCRGKNMPKASIDAAIKGAEKSKAGSYSLYEARGPGGSSMLIEVLTDNNTRTHQALKYLLQKHGGMMCDGARHSFEQKGVVLAPREGVSMDRALELAIEAGAEDVQETEDEDEKPLLQFVCKVSDLREVRSALEALGLPTISASREYVSHSPALLPLAQLEDASRLLDVLSDNPDVIRVWDNIQAQD